ncbi:MAG: hypothetical protein ACPG7F_17115, partial [Aggregatilineales bacterium]
MTQYQPQSHIDEYSWLALFEILSLRSTQPFWLDIGFDLPVTDSFQIITQNFVCEYGKPEKSFLSLWEEHIHQINQSEGNYYVDALIYWMQTQYYRLNENPSLRIWDTLLYRSFHVMNPLHIPLMPYLSRENFAKVKQIADSHHVKRFCLQLRLEDNTSAISDEAMSVWKNRYVKVHYLKNN